MKKFPEGFIWGGATGAGVSEGGYLEGGRGVTLHDCITAGSLENPRKVTWKDKFGNEHASPYMSFELPEGAEYAIFDDYYYPSHKAVDFYHRWKEDVDLLEVLGIKMFRVSISWSRLFPTGTETKPNEEGLRFYKDLFTELKNRGIEPLVTLWHGDTPLELLNLHKGWSSRETVDAFIWYAKTCFEEFKGLVHYWLTFNEINNTIQLLDLAKESSDDKFQGAFQIMHYQFLASAKTVTLAHSIDPNNKVGCMLCGIPYYSLTPDPEDVWETIRQWEQDLFYAGDVQIRGSYPAFARRLWKAHEVVLDCTEEDMNILKHGTVDFVAFSYYMSGTITSHEKTETEKGLFGERNPYLVYSGWNWAVDPKGLEIFCEVLWDRYHMPVLLVENGLGAQDTVEEDGSIHDTYRIDYLRSHIQSLQNVMDNGVDVMGYLVWSPIDVICMSTGQISKRYGLVHVDLDDEGNGTRDRRPKDSFDWYKTVIATNGEDMGEAPREKIPDIEELISPDIPGGQQ